MLASVLRARVNNRRHVTPATGDTDRHVIGSAVSPRAVLTVRGRGHAVSFRSHTGARHT